MIAGLAGWLAATSLLVLPGAWLAFGLPLPEASGRARTALAVTLAPPVLLLQFYLFRWAGLPFPVTVLALVAANLPAVILVWRRRAGWRLPPLAGLLAWALPVALAAAYLVTFAGDPQLRANWGHAWTHADIAYLVANGQLRPEEPMLAGIPMAYPWAGHVVQAVLSTLMDSPPHAGFLLLNLALLAAIVALVAESVALLGGGRAAQVAAAVLLGFGVNIAGTLAWRFLPASFLTTWPVFGDERFSPWLRKFGVFQQDPIGLAVVAATGLLALQLASRRPDQPRVVLVAVLVATVAVFYPLLWPAASALAGTAALVLLVRWWRERDAVPVAAMAGLVVALAVGAAALMAAMQVVTVARGDRPTMGFSTPWEMKVKLATVAIVLAPLWAGALAALRATWRSRLPALAVLGLGAASCLALYVALDIYHHANEYKFIFVAALALAPLAGIAVERAWRRWPRAAPPLALAGAVALAAPPVLAITTEVRLPRELPALDLSRFEVRLAQGQPLTLLLDAVRTGTPVEAVLVVRTLPWDPVTLTRRALYVPPDSGLLHGLGLETDYLLDKTRNYPMDLVARRRAIQRGLFEAGSDPDRATRLAELQQELGRPLVVMMALPADQPLQAWLEAQGARPVFRSASEAAWLVPAPGGL